MRWCEEKEVPLKFSQPNKSQQNTFIERFNEMYRHEVLNAYLFENLNKVCQITDKWVIIYNEVSLNQELGRLLPKDYQQKAENFRNVRLTGDTAS